MSNLIQLPAWQGSRTASPADDNVPGRLPRRGHAAASLSLDPLLLWPVLLWSASMETRTRLWLPSGAHS